MGDHRRNNDHGDGSGYQGGRGRGNRGNNNNYNNQNNNYGGQGYNENRHSGGSQYHRSFASGKRGREEAAADVGMPLKVKPEEILVTKLLNLCEKNQGTTQTIEHFFEDILRSCKKDIEYKGEHVLRLVLESAVQLSTKTQHYALLVGLLNTEHQAFIGSLVGKAFTDFSTSLGHGERDRARLLLRFIASMAVVNVVACSSAVALLRSVVDGAIAVGVSAADPSGASWQPYTDFLVYSVLATMPWCASDLGGECPVEFASLMAALQAYMDARPSVHDTYLQPFYGSRSETDLAAKSDSGAASFLTQLWESIRELEKEEWRLEALRPIHGPFQEQLSKAETHTLPAFELPSGIPGMSPSFCLGQASPLFAQSRDAPAAVRTAYPPRGGIRLLVKEHLEGSKIGAERFVAEEFILDTLTYFEADRTTCVLRLATALPASLSSALERDKVRNLLAEVLFGQLLALPKPKLSAAAYSTILIDLCKMRDFGFARALSSCVRELYSALPHMDPELRSRLVGWLSYHLSNFEYQWPWDRWSSVVDQHPSHPQRQFCQELLQRLLRLSYYQRVHKVLPEQFQGLLGPEPSVPLLPGQQAPAPTMPHPPASEPAPFSIEDVDMADPSAAASGEGPSVGATPMEPEVPAEPDAPTEEQLLAAGVLEQIRSKNKPSTVELLAWINVHPLGPHLGEQGILRPCVSSSLPVLPANPGPCILSLEPDPSTHTPIVGHTRTQAVVRALLVAGSKSPSHLSTAFERYSELLRVFTTADADAPAGREGPPRGMGATTLLEQCFDFYAELPQKALMAVDKLLSLGLVSPVAVVSWIMRSQGVRNMNDARACAMSWEVLTYVVERSMGRGPELREQIAIADVDLASAEAYLAQLQAQPSSNPRATTEEAHIARQVAGMQASLAELVASAEPAKLMAQEVLMQVRLQLAPNRAGAAQLSADAPTLVLLLRMPHARRGTAALLRGEGPGQLTAPPPSPGSLIPHPLQSLHTCVHLDGLHSQLYPGVAALLAAFSLVHSQLYLGMAALLGEEDSEELTAEDVECLAEWRELQYAHLRSFVRRHARATAAILPQLQAALAAVNALPRVVEAVESMLQLQPAVAEEMDA
ncbi:MAG: hypothetical protein WDW38_004354 [Sanguina aurantia]